MVQSDTYAVSLEFDGLLASAQVLVAGAKSGVGFLTSRAGEEAVRQWRRRRRRSNTRKQSGGEETAVGVAPVAVAKKEHA